MTKVELKGIGKIYDGGVRAVEHAKVGCALYKIQGTSKNLTKFLEMPYSAKNEKKRKKYFSKKINYVILYQS